MPGAEEGLLMIFSGSRKQIGMIGPQRFEGRAAQETFSVVSQHPKVSRTRGVGQ